MSKTTLFEGNCLDFLEQIPDRIIDAVITDPPYMSAMQHNGALTDYADCENLRPFYRAALRLVKAKLTEKGSLYWFCDWRTYPFYFSVLSEFFSVRNMLVWWKGSGAGNFYTSEHELIIFCTEDAHFVRKGARNVIQCAGFAQGAKTEDGEKVHPTQKPTRLIRRLICDATSEGDNVLDLFMGSGTTGVSSVQTARNFYGSELQHRYYEIAERRIKDAEAREKEKLF